MMATPSRLSPGLASAIYLTGIGIGRRCRITCHSSSSCRSRGRLEMVESFWAVPDVASFRPPLALLREQATALTEQTNGALVGIAVTKPERDGSLVVTLSVQVPALDNYVYRLLEYRQAVDGYPGVLLPAWGGASKFVTSVSSFRRSRTYCRPTRFDRSWDRY